jgi:hypothetical protein
MAVKECIKCGISKQLTEFYKSAKSKDGVHSYCQECHRAIGRDYGRENKDKRRERYLNDRENPEFQQKKKEYDAKRHAELMAARAAKQRAWALANPEKISEIGRKTRAKKQLLYIYRNIRKRAKARGMEFDIDYADIIVPDVCPIFGKPLLMNATIDDYDFAPSVDRIDSTKGYVKGNVQVISRLANCMKWTATREQLLTFAEGIIKLYGK